MSDPFLAEIKLVSFAFAPKGWALCNGQLLAINQNQALFALLGTTYGGDGRTNFALPNLRGRVPVHANSGNTTLGESGGQEFHTLTLAEIPAHTHLQGSVNQATSGVPTGQVLAAKPRRGVNVYASPPANLQIIDGPAASAGGSQPHENRQPFLTLNFVIALQGIFPSRP
jgi:microcystin-dependent protein